MNPHPFLTALLFVAVTLATGFATAAQESSGPVILINPFTVPSNTLDATIAMWEQARDFLQTQPGYVSTALHQSLTEDAQYRLINVAEWESAEAYMAATRRMRTEANLPRIEGVLPNPDLYTVIRRD